MKVRTIKFLGTFVEWGVRVHLAEPARRATPKWSHDPVVFSKACKRTLRSLQGRYRQSEYTEAATSLTLGGVAAISILRVQDVVSGCGSCGNDYIVPSNNHSKLLFPNDASAYKVLTSIQ